MIRCDQKRPICRWSLLLLVAGWFLLALFVGEIELLSIVPGAAVPITVLGLSIGLVAAYGLFVPLRRCLNALELRILILPHLARFVGIYFLVLYSRGVLPREFAVPAGWGDLIIALGAVALLTVPAALKNKHVLIAWNTVGLLDILYVVKTAASIIIANRDSMAVMTHLPLSLLPTLIVPLIIFTHIMMFARLLNSRSVQKPATEAGTSDRLILESNHGLRPESLTDSVTH